MQRKGTIQQIDLALEFGVVNVKSDIAWNKAYVSKSNTIFPLESHLPALGVAVDGPFPLAIGNVLEPRRFILYPLDSDAPLLL